MPSDQKRHKKITKQVDAGIEGRSARTHHKKKERNINWIPILFASAFLLLGGIGIAIALLLKIEPTLLEKQCEEFFQDIENGEVQDAGPYLINQCHDLANNCGFDVSSCQIPCPFDYEKDKLTKCYSCDCAFEGNHELDIHYLEGDIPRMMEIYGYDQLYDSVEFSLFSSSTMNWIEPWTCIEKGGRFKIPYTMEANIAAGYDANIAIAMKRIAKETCIDFVPRREEESYLEFARLMGCWASIGNQTYKQLISIGLGCEEVGTIQHEIIHALGFYHEHARPDRDSYVDYHPENVINGKETQFKMLDVNRVKDLGTEYDLNSLMHYDGIIFSTGPGPTLSYKGNLTPIRSNRISPSKLDLVDLNTFYDCKPEVLGQVVEGKWTDWAEWSACSRSCHLDRKIPYRRRFRRCIGPDDIEVMGCEGDPTNREQCKIAYCPKKTGQWEKWGLWGDCSKSCEKGSRMRKRACSEPQQCSGGYFGHERCATHKCGEKPTLVLSPWTIWHNCVGSCGDGKQKRVRQCKLGDELVKTCELDDGEYDEDNVVVMYRKCEIKCTKPQPWSSKLPGTTLVSTSTSSTTTTVATTTTTTTTTAGSTTTGGASWADWGLWKACSVSCAGGTKLRERECLGAGCSGNKTESDVCSTDPCGKPEPPAGLFTKNDGRYALMCQYGVLSVGDFNKDGRSDFICVFPDGYIQIFHAKTSGTFGEIDWEGETNFCQFSENTEENKEYKRGTKIHTADLNGDGYYDLLCFNMATGKIEVFLNVMGTFNSEPNWTGTRENCDIRAGAVIQLSDINGDGKSDLVCGDSQHSVKDIFMNEL